MSRLLEVPYDFNETFRKLKIRYGQLMLAALEMDSQPDKYMFKVFKSPD